MLATALLLVGSFCASAQEKPALDYTKTIEQWRANYEDDLKKPEGWLSVAGLFWLKQGANWLGSDPNDEVVLPAYASPAQAGILTLSGGKVTLKTLPGVDLKINDQPATDKVLASDQSGEPDRLAIGGVTFHVIQRADKIGIRLYDPKCKVRLAHQGLHWYPIDPKWAVSATFVPYDPPKTASIANVLGQITPVPIPGYLSFKVDGKECRLDAQDEPGGWFLDFQDKTSGKTTYGAGRFLDVTKPKEGPVIIDFNQATNPPCGYTAFATCPLPPKGNQLAVEITAGEKKYHR